MEIALSLLGIVVGAVGVLFGLELHGAVLKHHRKPKDFRTYGKGVNKNDYR